MNKLPPEPRLLLEGDVAAATPFVGIARKLAKQAYLSGIRAKTWQVGVGVVVRVENYLESRLSKVYVKAELLREIPYLSGIHEIASSNSLFEYYAGQFFPSRETERGIERKWYKYGNMPDYLWPPHNTDIETATKEEKFIIKWVVPSRPPLPDITAGGYAAYPNMYTGKMRLVQQKIYGYRRINPFEDNTNCGIFIPEVKDVLHINLQRWVIDIRSNGSVLAYKINFVNELENANRDILDTFHDLDQNEQDRYDYGIKKDFSIPSTFVPYSEWNNELENTGILLVPADGEIKAALNNKAPMTAWHSLWAFSYDGHEAQTVVVGEAPFNDEMLWRAYRYKLIVLQDNQGIPFKVEFTLVESDYLWTVKSAPAPLQDHPLSAPINNAFSEFIYYWRPDEATGGSWPPEHDAPVYVFYNKKNKPIILRHKFIQQTNLPDEIVSEPTDYYGRTFICSPPYNPLYGNCYLERSANTARLWNREWYTYDNRYERANCFYIEDKFDFVPESGYRSALHKKFSYGNFKFDQEAQPGSCSALYPLIIVGRHYTGKSETLSIHNVVRSYYHSVGVPAFNREAIFCFGAIEDETEERTNTLRAAEFSNGPVIFYTGWVTSSGIKVPGSDYVPAGDGSAGDGEGGVYQIDTLPAETAIDSRYIFISSNHEDIELLTPYNYRYWFAQLYQIYEAPIGSFSGVGAVLPWPRTDGVNNKIDLISKDNADKFIPPAIDEDIDYPINEANQYVSGPLSYPLIIFIGDDSTISKGLMPDIITDLEAIKVNKP